MSLILDIKSHKINLTATTVAFSPPPLGATLRADVDYFWAGINFRTGGILCPSRGQAYLSNKADKFSLEHGLIGS